MLAHADPGTSPSPRRQLFYFDEGRLEAVRDARWTLRDGAGTSGSGSALRAFRLFDLLADPAERFDAAAVRPEVVRRLSPRLSEMAAD